MAISTVLDLEGLRAWPSAIVSWSAEHLLGLRKCSAGAPASERSSCAEKVGTLILCIQGAGSRACCCNAHLSALTPSCLCPSQADECAAGEMNGKSGNINNVCAQMYPQGTKVPGTELLCIFDADQVASKEFFLKTVPLFDGGEPAAAHAPLDQAAPAFHAATAAPSQTPCTPLQSHSVMLPPFTWNHLMFLPYQGQPSGLSWHAWQRCCLPVC